MDPSWSARALKCAIGVAALQLEAGWKVTECRFEGEPRQLLLKLDFEQGKRFGCPQCGKPPCERSDQQRHAQSTFSPQTIKRISSRITVTELSWPSLCVAAAFRDHEE